jgi:hypothetical protein
MTSTPATTCTGNGNTVFQRLVSFFWSSMKNRVDGAYSTFVTAPTWLFISFSR